jgi:hypothetical protein
MYEKLNAAKLQAIRMNRAGTSSVYRDGMLDMPGVVLDERSCRDGHWQKVEKAVAGRA